MPSGLWTTFKKPRSCIFKTCFLHDMKRYNSSACSVALPCEKLGGVWLKLITLYLPEPYIKALDSLVDDRYYPNRAEAIRVAIRDLLSVEVWRKS